MRPILSLPAFLVVIGALAPGWAVARTKTITLDTVSQNQDVHWTVAERRDGAVVIAPPVFEGTIYGNVQALTIPFHDNDGFWIAHASFTLPAGATNPSLFISTLGVDDRAVVTLNGQLVTDSGTNDKGAGFMALTNAGHNVKFNFTYESGPENLTVTTGFVTGINRIQVIVNNTNQGIFGTLVPVTRKSPSAFGMTGKVVYTLPAQ